MKKFIAIAGVALIATLTVNAGLVTSWSDDFNGADGTVVAPSAKWALTNVVWQAMGVPNWNTHDRASNNEDVYIISNNQFYTYLGPCTLYTNVSERQKVQASFIPQESGTPVAVLLSNGIVTLEVDLADMWGNDGEAPWGSPNQEIKIALPCTSIITDTHKVTNYYQIAFKIDKYSSSNYAVYAQSGTKTIGAKSFANVDYASLPVLPKSAKLTVQNVAGDAVAKLYIDGNFVGMTNAFTAAQMATLYPYIWEGRFSGGGAEISDGALFLDNYSVAWVPEPSVFLLTLLAIPLWRKFRS